MTFTMVRWNNSFSCLLLMRSGIRQGGILSPLLFNIYINTIFTAWRKPIWDVVLITFLLDVLLMLMTFC